MVAAMTLWPVRAPSGDDEPRILLSGVPWAAYVVLRDSIESPSVRMTFLDGRLEIMSPSRAHEINKTQLARLFELFCLELGIPLYAYGSTTFRAEEKQRGLEPDECYCRGVDRLVPDVALEVVVSHASIDKLEVYRGLGVREVWVFEGGAVRVLELQGDRYAEIESSRVFPEADLGKLAKYAMRADQPEALIALRDELRRGSD
ncbi:MAG: Uma2 family endonuclease [Polyangiaceae bacterium]